MYYIKTNDQVKIAVYEYNSKGIETVVLLHGWPLSSAIFEYQLPLLIENHYRVIALDMRGFGASDTSAGGYCYDRMAEDLYNVVCALRLQQFTLVGFSMGGAVALRYMRKFRSFGVKKLILLSAASPSLVQGPGNPCGLSKNYLDGLIQLACTDRPKLAENFSRQLFALPQSVAVIDWFRLIALSASGLGTVQGAIALREENGLDDLSCVKVPTFIIHGDKDQIVSNELAEIQHQYIGGSELFTLANSGHGVMYDQLQPFNQCFLKALQS